MSALFRGELARRLKMRYVPTLTFKIDESIQYGMKIDKLFDDIKSERSPLDEDEDLL